MEEKANGSGASGLVDNMEVPAQMSAVPEPFGTTAGLQRESAVNRAQLLQAIAQPEIRIPLITLKRLSNQFQTASSTANYQPYARRALRTCRETQLPCRGLVTRRRRAVILFTPLSTASRSSPRMFLENTWKTNGGVGSPKAVEIGIGNG